MPGLPRPLGSFAKGTTIPPSYRGYLANTEEALRSGPNKGQPSSSINARATDTSSSRLDTSRYIRFAEPFRRSTSSRRWGTPSGKGP
jgi:hypothetical protein